MSYWLVLSALLLHGFAPGTSGFSLCGSRTQFGGVGALLYYGNAPGDEVLVENRCDAIVVKSAFLPSTNITMIGVPGRYRFCVYWFPGLRMFKLTYGLKNYTWDVERHSHVQDMSTEEPLECAPDTIILNMTVNGIHQPSNCSYQFQMSNWSRDSRLVKKEIAAIGQQLDEIPIKETKAEELRGWIERTLSQVQFEGQSHHFGKGSLRAAVYKLQSSDMLSRVHQDVENSVSFPRELVPTRSSQPTRLHVVRVRSHSVFQDAARSSLLSEQVIGISVESRTVTNLTETINITFQHRPVEDNYTSVCVFWNESGRAWSTEGCETQAQRSSTTCKCNHLTYFAVLMHVSSQNISEAHLVYLSVITFAGCSISALAALFTIFWYQCTRRKQCTPTVLIHLNLLGALLLLDLSFMCSAILGAVPIPALCQGSAILLHMAQLCTITWMAIEGYNLYRLVIKVFNSSLISTRKLAVLGWGAPLLIVIVILLVDHSNYGMYDIEVTRTRSHASASLCWLTKPLIHYVVNVGYFAVVLLSNMVMLVAMIRRVLRIQPHSRKEHVRHCITLLGLSCMFGLPWAVAFCAFGELYLPAQYLFSCLNSLQGFFIFLWFCTLTRSHTRHSFRSCDNTSATPASPQANQNSTMSDEKKPLT